MAIPQHRGRITVELLHAAPVAGQPIDIVERKGLGHPDSICDAIAEQVALALVRAYRQQFGTILHFNVDKGLLAAGAGRAALWRRAGRRANAPDPRRPCDP